MKNKQTEKKAFKQKKNHLPYKFMIRQMVARKDPKLVHIEVLKLFNIF